MLQNPQASNAQADWLVNRAMSYQGKTTCERRCTFRIFAPKHGVLTLDHQSGTQLRGVLEMRSWKTVAASLVLAAALAGCGGGARPSVCNVRPSADGKSLVYSPPGCQNHLSSETLNVETSPAP